MTESESSASEAHSVERRGPFEVFVGEDEQFYWRLKAKNGEVMSVSEGYTTRSNAWRGVDDAAGEVEDYEG